MKYPSVIPANIFVPAVQMQILGAYIVMYKSRNPDIYEMLTSYVNTLDKRSVEYALEMDYFGKYYTYRNWYIPESLKQQANVTSWFLTGKDVPKSIEDNLVEFWTRHYYPKWKVLNPLDVPCSRYEASGGVCVKYEKGEYIWWYGKKGPEWDNIQLGTEYWITLVIQRIPNEWLNEPITALINKREPRLEALVLERPVVRTEGGPGKTRWARSSSSNPYILGRMFAEQIQNGPFSKSPEYLGKSSNVQMAALKLQFNETEEFYIATHGDDWIAYCPHCGRWHSGDWGNFDHHASAKQILAAYEAFRKVYHPTGNDLKLLYALAYFQIRTPTIWLWDKSGQPSMSIRSTLGRVRSGSGEFILFVNNALNRSALEYLLGKTHEILFKLGKKFPCRSRSFWKVFSGLAKEQLGWIAKPSAQLTHPHGFIGCRAVFTRENLFTPRPSVTSVVRNWVNPASDPCEYPNSTRLWQRVRFRDVNETMAWAPPEIADSVMECLYDVARVSGADDPYGLDETVSSLSRAVQKVVSSYSMRTYLDS